MMFSSLDSPFGKNVDTFYNVDNDSIMMYEQPSPWDDWMT